MVTDKAPELILIVEDESLVSLMLEELVREMGARAVDVFASAGDAVRAAANRRYDCAILDYLVRDGTSVAVADILSDRGIPFVFSSALDANAFEPRHRTRPLIPKPFEDHVLRAQIASLLAAGPNYAAT